MKKECKKCGGGIADAKYDAAGKPIWSCRNCYKEYPRIVKNTKKKQERAGKRDKWNKMINDLTANEEVHPSLITFKEFLDKDEQ